MVSLLACMCATVTMCTQADLLDAVSLRAALGTEQYDTVLVGTDLPVTQC